MFLSYYTEIYPILIKQSQFVNPRQIVKFALTQTRYIKNTQVHYYNAILSSCDQHHVLHFTTILSSITDRVDVQVCRFANNKRTMKLKMAKEKMQFC